MRTIAMFFVASALAVCSYSVLGGKIDIFKILFISFIVSISFWFTPIGTYKFGVKETTEDRTEKKDV